MAMNATGAMPGQRAPDTTPLGVDPTRARPAVRALLDRQPLTPHQVTAPLLVLPERANGGGLPGTVPLSGVTDTVRRWTDLGILGIKLFAYGGDHRDPQGSGATVAGNPMVVAIAAVKAACSDMVVTTEVCGCSWTDNGECALLTPDGRADRNATYDLMGAMAVEHAKAGADVVSPTAMLDGSIRAVRRALTEAGYPDVGVCPNIAIHTSLYGPFKRLMRTNPACGDRRGYQLEPCRADRDVLTIADRWLAEGADSLTLQPVMTCTDLLVRLRQHVRVPIIAYSTSGEYPALSALGTDGMVEYHAGLLRAGADLVLTYAAEQVARALRGRS
jgi:porphobilinogen synthase